ncbi:MAG: hypothetical protein WCK53_11015 [Methanomicrobiales archaeon]
MCYLVPVDILFSAGVVPDAATGIPGHDGRPLTSPPAQNTPLRYGLPGKAGNHTLSLHRIYEERLFCGHGKKPSPAG